MESLDRHGIHASVPLNSEVCDRYPMIKDQFDQLYADSATSGRVMASDEIAEHYARRR
jgi:hypothetical protein